MSQILCSCCYSIAPGKYALCGLLLAVTIALAFLARHVSTFKSCEELTINNETVQHHKTKVLCYILSYLKSKNSQNLFLLKSILIL